MRATPRSAWNTTLSVSSVTSSQRSLVCPPSIRTSGSTYEVQIAGRGLVPNGAAAAVINLTVVGSTAILLTTDIQDGAPAYLVLAPGAERPEIWSHDQMVERFVGAATTGRHKVHG